MAILGGLKIHSTPVGNSNRVSLASKINIRRNQVETARLKQRPRIFSEAGHVRGLSVLLGMAAGCLASLFSLPLSSILVYGSSISLGMAASLVAGIAGLIGVATCGTAIWLIEKFVPYPSPKETKNGIQIDA